MRGFSILCDYFVDNKLSIHFERHKIRSILSGNKHKLRNARSLNIAYNSIENKQHELKYLGCLLDGSLCDESMALNLVDKVNSRLKFLHRQNRF